MKILSNAGLTKKAVAVVHAATMASDIIEKIIRNLYLKKYTATRLAR
jgi:hypothetical protein